MSNLNWLKCNDDRGNLQWCSFEAINLDDPILDGLRGVYVIFYQTEILSEVIVRVGQGNIAERIEVHRKDDEITKYADEGLLVTWAIVDENKLDGVETFLGQTLEPLVGVAFPDVDMIAVNSPF